MKLFYLVFALLIYSSIYPSQNMDKRITGKVLHGQTQEPLAFANIWCENSEIGTSSGENGDFELTIPKNTTEILISYLGFRTKIIQTDEIKEDDFLLVLLSPKDILLQEVAIYNKRSAKTEKLEISSLALETDKISKISNAMPDVLRAFQALPGISANNEFSAEFNVRGGNKDENLIQVNGAQVYEPYHLKEAQNASVGVFNVELIDQVNIVTGGFSARYGDRLSSVANVEYREGERDNYKGSATLSMAFVDGYIEGPLLNNGSFIIAARKTYMEYLIDLTDFGYSEIRKADPTFYDFQGVLAYDLSKDNKLKLSFLHSADNWKYNPTPTETSSNYSGNYFSQPANFNAITHTSYDQVGNYYSSLIDLQSINILSSKALIKAKASYYDQRDKETFITNNIFTENIITNENYYTKNTNTHFYQANINIHTLEFETELDYQVHPFYDLKTGAAYKNVFYNMSNTMDRMVKNSAYTPEFPDTFNTSFISDLAHLTDLDNANSYKYSAYIENIFQVKENLIFNIAGRMDYFDMNKELSFSPRLNIAYSTNFGTTFRAAWGHYYQSPIYTQLVSPTASDENTKSQMAIHYITGIEQDISLSSKKLSTLKIKFDIFYKDYKSLISSYYSHYDKLFYSRKNDAVGYSKGFDTYILLNIPNFYTWVSYSYLLAMEDEIGDKKGAYPRLTGQEHTLSWITNFNLGKGWGLTTKYFYGSGYPYSEKTLFYYEKSNEYIWETESTTTSYLPDYSRFDLRISKDIEFSSFTIKTFLEISNMLNHKNIRGYEYSYDNKGNPIVNEIQLWPMLPSFGIKFEF